MGVSKVDYYGETLIDLTGDTVTPESVVEGVTFTNSAGEKKEGTFVPFSGDYNDLVNKPVSYASITDIDYLYNSKADVTQGKLVTIYLDRVPTINKKYVIVLRDESGFIYERVKGNCARNYSGNLNLLCINLSSDYIKKIEQIDGTEWDVLFENTIDKDITLQIYDGETYTVFKLADEFIPDGIVRSSYLHDNYDTSEELSEKLSAFTDSKAEANHKHAFNELLDKPFGEEEVTEIVAEEQTPMLYDATVYASGNLEVLTHPAESSGDETFVVTIDGTPYYCTSWVEQAHDPYSVYIGDSRMWGEDANVIYESHPENVPFLVEFWYSEEGENEFGFPTVEFMGTSVYFPDDTPRSVKIEKPTGETTVKQLDEKFIPDTIARKSDIVVNVIDATKHGVLPTNEPLINSQNLQALIDSLTKNGGTIYIPKGVYRFGSNAKTLFADACVMLKSNVSIVGDGNTTILKPVGSTTDGLDMFHYDGILDGNEVVYLENCKFEDFVIDGEEANLTGTYTAFGKGIMASPIKRCYFNRLIVKNTDATGIGVDCPVDCYVTECATYNCGKAGEVRCSGASGIGIGFGYSENETMVISNCRCDQNKMFGIFFEHQRRFGESTFPATQNKGFVVENCTCYGNNYNFGGLQADNVMFRNCYSRGAKEHGFFLENSKNCSCEGCYSVAETNTSFVVLCAADNGKTVDSTDNTYTNCISKYTAYGCKIVNTNDGATMDRIAVKDCIFNLSQIEAIRTSGKIGSLIIHGNVSNGANNTFGADVTNFINKQNSWNEYNIDQIVAAVLAALPTWTGGSY